MTDDGFKLRKEQFTKALGQLKAALNLYEGGPTRPAEEREAFRDSVIQRFEFTFELSWKTMQAWLKDQGVVANSPKQAMGESFSSRLISDETGWSELQKARNMTSHTYDPAKALEVVALIRAKGISLFDELAAQLDKS